jgi:Zn-finger nucleic acid-binding protein
MDWKIGDVAVCVKVGNLDDDRKGAPPPLRLNAEYLVHNIYQCPKCKGAALDVGFASESFGKEGYTGTNCSKNCTEHIPCKEVHWCSAMRFVKRKTKEQKLAEAIENEDYELAGELRDKIKNGNLKQQ